VPNLYEITFKGEAGPTIAAAFPELMPQCGDGVTVLHGALTDQAALHGILERIQSLGLELIEVHRVGEGDPSGAE
jgi:hypothetical protein